MNISFEDKRDAVAFVEDLLKAFPQGSASITTTEQGRYVVSFVHTATDTSSEDLEAQRAQFFSATQVNT